MTDIVSKLLWRTSFGSGSDALISKDMVREAAAEITRLRAEVAGKWLPIESAPKDGTPVLLYAPICDYQGVRCDARVTFGYWSAPEHGELIGDCGGVCRCLEYADAPEPYWYSEDGGFLEELPPTHWMPLPTPPQPESAT